LLKLKKKDSFDRLFKSGKKFNSKSFSLIALNDKKKDNFFYAVIVSKKNIPLAVNRNKIKRLMRAAIKEVFSKFDSAVGLSLFIYNSKKTLSYSLIEEEIYFLLQKL